MPIVTVRIVADDAPPPADRAQRLADALGSVFRTAPGRTWVRVEDVPRTNYAENGPENGTALPDDVRPVFVEVLLATLGTTSQCAIVAAQITDTVAAILDRSPDNVHVLYLPAAEGRIAFGGVLRTDSASGEHG